MPEGSIGHRPTEGLERSRLDPEFFRQSHFRFVVDFLQAGETRKGKPVDGNCADFADRRFVQSWSAAFFMDQCEHCSTSWGFVDVSMKPFDMLRATETMVARNQMEFDWERRIARE